LHNRLIGYDPTKPAGILSKFLRKPEAAPEGLYLYGGVGRGKSMLMDLFYEGAPVPKKRRAHFHEFMLDVHARIHNWRQMTPDERKAKGGHDDPIPPLATDLANDAWLLCFDEFQVTDVADAMILSRLFTALFDAGVVVVSTSNRRPDTLYEHGINRHFFLPFLDLVDEKMDVLHLDSPTDYRLARLMGAPVYYHPLSSDSVDLMEQAWLRLTDGAVEKSQTLYPQAREFIIARVANDVPRFTFDELCNQPLGSADYLEIAYHFHTVLIDDIPQMSGDQRNEAKRFVTLIDAFYENGVKLICSAQVEPNALYVSGTGSFEFGRTASRLMEIQSDAYLKA
jgi:cell division protein ZapE